MTRYQALAGKIEDDIRAGRVPGGQRLPSVRDLSSQEGVSPSTVVEAYALLQERGWIESRARSGFFAARVASGPASLEVSTRPTLVDDPFALKSDDLIFALRQAAHDPKILPLGAATPAASFYPYKAIARSVTQAFREEPALASDYSFPPGSPALRKQIARRYQGLGVDCDASSIVTTSGALEGISHALKLLTRPGDIVLLESPTYFGILQAVRSFGCRVLEVPAHPVHGIEPAALRSALKSAGEKVSAAILVPNHSNPLGARMPDETKGEILDIAKKAGMTIIEDDVYGDLSFGASRPKPLQAWDKSGNVILCSSFSKTAAPGLRVGYIISRKHASELSLQRTSFLTGVSTVAEESLAHYLGNGGFDRHLRQVRREYETLLAQFSSAMIKSFPEGTRISQPRGGYVLWVQLPEGADSRLIQKRALDQGISVASGTLFSSARNAYLNHLRINCALPWSPIIERGIQKLGKIVTEACA